MSLDILLAVLVMSVANLITRLLPFVFFAKNNPPKIIVFISKFFPPVILTILIFYTLGSIDFENQLYGLKEFIAIAITAYLHIKFSNYLISIIAGTISYMLMIQFI